MMDPSVDMDNWSELSKDERSDRRRAMNAERDKMQDTVDALCDALRYDLDSYEVHTHTIKFDNGTELWRSDLSQIWTGTTTETVFTHKQAREISDAYIEGRETKKTRAQEQMQKRFAPKPKKEKKTAPVEIETNGTNLVDDRPWWRFW